MANRITQDESLSKSPLNEYLGEQFAQIKSMLSSALNMPAESIKVSFPSLQNFYLTNNVYKSSWAIYTNTNQEPKLLFTGNFIIQGGQYAKRSQKSPFGMDVLSPLISIANTYSADASVYKQNWTMDLALLEDEEENKLKFTVSEYKEFLKLLNQVRAHWLLHLSEEGNYDFVIIEFSEPSDQVFFVDLDNVDSLAIKIKTYFKPISPNSLNAFKQLALNTEFEGRFCNLQPGAWLKDDVIIEMGSFHKQEHDSNNAQFILGSAEPNFNNPFKIQTV